MGTTPLGLRLQYFRVDREEENVTIVRGVVGGCVVHVIWATCPLVLVRTCKNQQAIAC